eukprot:17687-Heterococcus_DN1.PRE.2
MQECAAECSQLGEWILSSSKAAVIREEVRGLVQACAAANGPRGLRQQRQQRQRYSILRVYCVRVLTPHREERKRETNVQAMYYQPRMYIQQL